MKKFSIFTVVVTFVSLILGNLVVATNSGDACGTSWPFCNGQVIPDFTDYHVLVEYSHRLFIPLLAVVTFINAVGAIYFYKRKRSVLTFAALSLILLVVQSLIGGFNVLLGTPPGFTTLDVTFSQLLLLNNVLLSYSLHENPVALEKKHQGTVKMSYRAFVLGFMFYIAQVVFGAFFKHSRASNVMLDVGAEEYLIESEALANTLFSLHWVATVIILVSAIWFIIYASKFRYHIFLSWLYFLTILLNGAVGIVIVVTGNLVLASSIHMILSTLTTMIGGAVLGGYWFKLKQRAF
ncbi:COX15/CtaA family protein [Salimicrobium halophilum]|uniref:Cytochrome c oxidase assembly protein subunit 15 n=1 Tax=Salimicrobium halophilum TaxID=86666 RepID=A0A1G8V4D1_9BACI|nr:COX15/CtaA family protein [Salimicrobium halophilum]SDJ60901.1 cytochrome c oxidase assembly protein subunit 15 [Salimicrobium halophilum]